MFIQYILTIMLKNAILILFITFIISCNNSEYIKKTKDLKIKSPQEIYSEAYVLFNNENYSLAKTEFLKVTKLYPLSNEAIQSEIMLGFISYIKMDYESAILEFERVIRKYPSHNDLDYVYYMKAICNYEQITHEGLDGTYNELALKNFQQVIKRFPDSKYAKDSRQKIILIKSNYAAKHMNVGRFYLKEKKYTAALNRFKIVIEEYSSSKFTPEALHRMVEAYMAIGMIDDSLKTASTLGHNYPNSKWYKYSYDLINNENKQGKIVNRIKEIF